MPRQYIRPIRAIIYPVGPSIAYVPLTRHKLACIDASDAPLVSGSNWNARWCERLQGYYASRGARTPDGRSTTESMHRIIMGARGAITVDHANNARTLDNRRANLRFASRRQQAYNRGQRCTAASALKGIQELPSGRYMVRIQAEGVRKYLGIRDTPEAAAELYRNAAVELHGEFARFE